MRSATSVLLLALLGWAGAQRRGGQGGQPCPPGCICVRRTVRCMKLGLEEVPRTAPTTLTVDLRFNKIRDLPPGTFKAQRNLNSLLLNNNLLVHLKNGVFDGLIHLQHLYLYANRINTIEPEVFRGLKSLERLYLHSNELETFDAGTFSNLPSLERLNLYNNRLHHIPKDSFQGLPRLSRLRLDHNALICDCELAWLTQMRKNHTFHISANCRHPKEMSGKSLAELSMEDLHCGPPKITEEPQDIEVSFGGTAMFSCKVYGDPSTKIVWMKEDKELPENSYKYSMDNGTLMVKNTEESDGGVYECMAKNKEGFVVKSRPARMVVNNNVFEVTTHGYGSPRFLEVPQTISTNVGTPEITLRCRAFGQPPPSIKWSFNFVRLFPSGKHIFNPDGSLTVRDIQGSDHGTYQCDASNVNGRITAQANIMINVAPIFTIQPENTDATVGSTVRLECVAQGSPTPELIWYKNDLEVDAENPRISLHSGGTVLEIKDLRESDSDLYICEARNVVGMREVSARIKVRNASFKRPKLVYKPYNIEAIVGGTIELPCKAVGDPQPGITWQKDGATMQRTGRFRVSLTGNLYIYKVNPEDQGRYECSAVNDYGRDTASGYVTVKADPLTQGLGVGDNFVKIAFAQASNEIDKAINNTIDNFLHNKNPSAAELFRIIRYPDAPARELARAAEVYERTLVNIRRLVEKGNMKINNTKNFDYNEILSAEHLELIARLSGCLAHRLTRNCSDMCFHSKYRSIDGTCNNLQHPTWGASLTGFRRILKPIYEDDFGRPIGWNKEKRYYGFPKPPSRKVSTTLISTKRITPDAEITHMVMQWGQFLDHDLDHSTPSVSSESYDGIDCKKSCDYAAPCYPMDVPKDDPRISNRRCIDFIRSAAICGSGMTSVFFDSVQYREQINQLTSYIDASQVYGFSEELAKDLRDLDGDGGRLRDGVVFPGRKPLLPYTAGNQGVDCRRNLSESEINCFVAGDIRANEQVGLLAMHTLWMREHNRIARELKYLNPHWDGDTLYHESRKIVGAVMQHITYTQWMPYIIGKKGMETLGKFTEYDPNIHPSISNVFATAALRFGHTLINPILHRLDENFKPIREGHLPLHKAFFSPWRIVDEGGIDPLLRGLFSIPAKVKRPEENLNEELTEKLFKTAHAVALDLAAMNIHRSRDHGLPGYIEYRKFCNMTPVDTFEDLQGDISDANVIRKLKELYGHPGNIDVFVGGILEDQKDGARIGPLFSCLLIEQFKRLRDGDRFWYENPSVFKPEQLVQIKQYTLARVLCDNGDNITKISRDVFKLPNLQGGYVECDEIPKVDFRLWSECCSDCRYTGQLNTISRLNARRNRRHLTDDESQLRNTTITVQSEEIFKLKKKMAHLENEMIRMKKKMNKMVKTIQMLEGDNFL